MHCAGFELSKFMTAFYPAIVIVAEDIHTVEVRWTKTGEDGQEDAIAKSRFNPNASFVFKSAPAELQGRFSIDGQFFKSKMLCRNCICDDCGS